MTILIRLVLAVLTVYRLANLFALDVGPFAILERFRHWLGRLAAREVVGLGDARHQVKGWRWSLSELFNCPFCLGLWLAGLVSLLVFFPTTVGDGFLIVLGIAGGQDYLTQRRME